MFIATLWTSQPHDKQARIKSAQPGVWQHFSKIDICSFSSTSSGFALFSLSIF